MQQWQLKFIIKYLIWDKQKFLKTVCLIKHGRLVSLNDNNSLSCKPLHYSLPNNTRKATILKEFENILSFFAYASRTIVIALPETHKTADIFGQQEQIPGFEMIETPMTS